MRRYFPILAVSLALVLLAGCTTQGTATGIPTGGTLPDGFRSETPGSGTASPEASEGGSPRSSVSGKPDEHPDDGDSHKDDGDSNYKFSAENPPPSGFRDPDVDGGKTGAGKLSLKVKIDPTCAEQGESILVTLKTKPDVQVSFFTQFKEEPSGKMRVYEGRSNAQGLYSQRLDVRSDQEPFQYTLFGAAADDKGTDGGHSGQWFHVVAEKGGCNR